MENKFISIIKARMLERIISFLSEYTPVEGEEHHIGSNLDEVDPEKTALLIELGQVNKRRKELIDLLMAE